MAIRKHAQAGLSAQAGVTLIEMLVVVAIIAIVSSVIMFNYSDFSSNVSVRNLSQEIALAVRKSQTYATSVRSIDGTNITDSSAFGGYGISFSTSETVTSPNLPGYKRFVLFVEVPPFGQDPDGLYYQNGEVCGSPNTQQECAEVFSINTADKVVAICADPASTTILTDCTTTGSVDISFRRPSPDARIKYRSEAGVLDENVGHVLIVLESAKGLKRGITVWNTGQISVQ